MAKKSFAIIHNLDSLNEVERKQYLRDASVYFGLDPDLNALDLIYMNDDQSGMRKLCAYARKGTTDILRGIHGIEILDISPIDIPGTVSFKATGKNKEGRQEIAIGACDISGLKGEKLAYAVMTAETRAGRRLTLKFVGGGLLDESEVNAQLANIGSSSASLASLAGSPVVMPPPQVPVSAAPGRDITPIVSTVINHEENTIAHEGPISIIGRAGDKTSPVASTVKGSVVMQAKETPSDSTAGNVSADAPKKRTRRKRGSVDISSPGQETPVSAALAKPEVEKDTVGTGNLAEPSLPEKVSTPVALAPVTLPAASAVESVLSAQSPELVVPLSPEKQKEYRERLNKYSSDILPKAGMTPSEGIGGSTMKLRLFASLHTGGQNGKLTEAQFEDLFEFLDGYAKQNGAPALVAYIDKALGVK